MTRSRRPWTPEQRKLNSFRNTRYRERRLQQLFELKAERTCESCGADNPIVLDFHHRDPDEKSFTISDAYRANMAWDRVLAEIDKCTVLCANCHRLHHWQQLQENKNSA